MTILEAICSRVVRLELASRDRAYELYGALLVLGVPRAAARAAAARAFAQQPSGMFEDQLRVAAGLVRLDVMGESYYSSQTGAFAGRTEPAAKARPHGGRPENPETKTDVPSRQPKKENQ